MTTALKSVNKRIAEELDVREEQVRAAVELLDGGSTVPFIARYRKEVTGTLDDTQLRQLDERRGRRGTSPSPTPCLPTPPPTRLSSIRSNSTAHGRFSSSVSPRTRIWWVNCAN